MSKTLKMVQGVVPQGAPFDPKMYATLNLPKIVFPKHRGMKLPNKVSAHAKEIQGTVPQGAPFTPKMTTTGITSANRKDRVVEIDAQIAVNKQLTDDITAMRLGETMSYEKKAKNYAPVIDSLNQLGLINFATSKDLPAGIAAAVAIKVQEWLASVPKDMQAARFPELMKNLAEFVADAVKRGEIPDTMVDDVLRAIRRHPGLAGIAPAAAPAPAPGTWPARTPSGAPVATPTGAALIFNTSRQPTNNEKAAITDAYNDYNGYRELYNTFGAAATDDQSLIDIATQTIIDFRDTATDTLIDAIKALSPISIKKFSSAYVKKNGAPDIITTYDKFAADEFRIGNDKVLLERSPTNPYRVSFTLGWGKTPKISKASTDSSLLLSAVWAGTGSNPIPNFLWLLSKISNPIDQRNIKELFDKADYDLSDKTESRRFWENSIDVNTVLDTIKNYNALGLPSGMGAKKMMSPNKIAARLDKMLAAGQINDQEYAKVMRSLE